MGRDIDNLEVRDIGGCTLPHVWSRRWQCGDIVLEEMNYATGGRRLHFQRENYDEELNEPFYLREDETRAVMALTRYYDSL